MCFNVVCVCVCTGFRVASWISGFISSVESLSCVWLFVTPWTAARQASLSNSLSLFTLMSIELVMPSNHLILFCPLLLLPSSFPTIIIFIKFEKKKYHYFFKYCFYHPLSFNGSNFTYVRPLEGMSQPTDILFIFFSYIIFVCLNFEQFPLLYHQVYYFLLPCLIQNLSHIVTFPFQTF